MPDFVHRIGNCVEARPDELWALGQTIRYARDRNVTWARRAPPFPSRDSPLPNTREAIFDLWRELAAGTTRAIQNYREVHPSRWSLEVRLIIDVLEKQGETTGDFGPFLAAVESSMGDMLFPAVELIRAFPRRTPFQLAGLTEIVEPGASKAPAEFAETANPVAQAPANAPEPIAPTLQAAGKSEKPVTERRPLTPGQLRIRTGLLSFYPEGRGADAYEEMVYRLGEAKIKASRTSLVRVLAEMPAEWRDHR